MNHFPELKTVPNIVKGENPSKLGHTKLKQNKLSDSTILYDRWNRNLSATAAFLNQIGINYVLIKNIDIPYAFMKDIDFMIEGKNDVARLKTALKQLNFVVQKRDLAKSDKVTAIGEWAGSRVEIDVYVDPAWWKIDYAPHGLISSKCVKKEVFGRVVCVPPPTFDLFILATHSYWHGSVSLAEVSQIAKLILIGKIEWDALLSMARTYHLEHPVYLYLTLINEVFHQMGHEDAGFQRCIAELKRNHLCRLLVDAVEKKNRCFPLQIPYIFKLVSSVDELLTSFTQKRLSYKEGQSYFLCLLMRSRIRNI
jgi:hypothetical protein